MNLLNKLITIMLILSALPALADNRVAIVKSRYDNIELILSTYRIPYDLIDYSDLGNEETFRKYRSLFFPSGLASDYENNLDVNWQGKEITSVKLGKNFFELDQKKFKTYLRNFIRRGGSAYFSGYAFRELSTAYDYFDFFDNFPYLGLPGRLEATLYDDLARFSLKRKYALYMDYPGWIAIKDVDNALILSESTFDTPKGEKSGPVSVLIKDGAGEIIYTSYYSTVYSEFRRFNIYRIAGYSLMKRTASHADEFFQDVTGRITDAFHAGEASRTYYFDLSKGINTFYLQSESSPFAFEVYDSSLSLVASVEKYELSQTWTISSATTDYCYITIYPGSHGRYGMHSIVSASGTLVPKPVKTAAKVFLYTLGFIFAAAFIKVAASRFL